MLDPLPPATDTTEPPDATLKPPQFSLRTLLIGTTLVAALLSLLLSVGGGWALAILLFTTLVAAHVIGNSLGTRLRNGAPQRPVRAHGPRAAHGATALRHEFPTSRLYEHRRLHWINLVLTAAGLAAGAYFGGQTLAATYPEATLAAHVLAYLSSGVLGALAAFIVSSFLMVVRQAISDAHAGSDRALRRADSQRLARQQTRSE